MQGAEKKTNSIDVDRNLNNKFSDKLIICFDQGEGAQKYRLFLSLCYKNKAMIQFAIDKHAGEIYYTGSLAIHLTTLTTK